MDITFSIITICRNAAEVLPRTIESVLAQNLRGFEYIIKDGASTDRTEQIVSGYRSAFEEKNIKFVFESDKDGGIYDAMNIGAKAATGDYINFMNAGDCFYSSDVLSKIEKVAGCFDKEALPGVIYGDCAVSEYDMFYLFKGSYSDIEERMPFSHQSAFVRNDIVRSHPFNTTYRFSADYDFLLTVHGLGEEFVDSGTIVCISTADGLSSIKYHDTLMESAAILKSHGMHHLSEKELSKKEKELRIKQFVLDHFPDGIKKMIRARQISSRGQALAPVLPEWFIK